MVIFTDMLMCSSCVELEIKALNEHISGDDADKRVIDARAIIDVSRQIDDTVKVVSDLFNAKTIAIIELDKAIQADDTIENKPYALAQFLHGRFVSLQSSIFGHKEAIVDETNEQKAIQLYFNQLSNRLRAEEREQFKIADINYKPSAPVLKKPKPIKAKAVKMDRVELNKYATELGVSASQLQTICIRRGCSVADAAKILQDALA
jgi:hypothetical protein